MHITFRRREPQVTPFHGFRHVLILKCTCWILQVRVNYLAHLIIIHAFNDDVHTCTVRQVDVVNFVPWAFLQKRKCMYSKWVWGPYTLLRVFSWLRVSLCFIACVLMIDPMYPYAWFHVSLFLIACVLILECICPYTWLHMSLWLIACVLMPNCMCPYTWLHMSLLLIACVLMLDS